MRPNSTVATRQRVRAAHLRRNRNNDQEIYVLTPQELTRIWRRRQRSIGLSDEEIDEQFHALTGYAANSAVGLTSPAMDGVVLTRLATDLHRGGGILTTYRVIKRGNQTLIALRGRAGLRIYLNATTYNHLHPKILKMAIGAAGQRAMAVGGIIVTVVISPVVRTAQWIFDDQFTWAHLLGNVSTDVVKGIISAGATIAGSMTTTAIIAGSVPVIVPIAVGLFVAVLAGIGLNSLDNHYQITERLVEALAAAQANWENATEQVRRDAKHYFGTTHGQLDFIRRFSSLR